MFKDGGMIPTPEQQRAKREIGIRGDIINSLRAITGMAGPILFTQVFALAISPGGGFHLPGAPYFLAAVLLFSSLMMAANVTRPSEAAAASSLQRAGRM